MADDHNPRTPHGDPYARTGRAHSPEGHASNDPLAELARLIGQNDPFADFGRESARHAPAHHPRDWPSEQPARDWEQSGQRQDDRGYGQDQGAPHYHEHERAADQYADHGYAQPAARYSDAGDPYAERGSDRYADEPADPYAAPPAYAEREPFAAHGEAASPVHARQAFDARHADDPDDGYYDSRREPHAFAGEAQEPAYHPRAAEAPIYENPYGRDAAPMPPPHAGAGPYRDDDEYEEKPPAPRRRGGLVVVMAVLGLAVVGTAAAYGYRAMFGPASMSAPPPVIKADATPSKVVPATPNSEQPSTKLSQDRVGDRATAEKVVVREEQPVEMKEGGRPGAPRSVFPPPGVAQDPPSGPGAPTVPPGAQASAANEPKKVRTVTIRPDKNGGFATVPTAQRTAAPVTSPFPEPPAATRSAAPRAAVAQPQNANTEPLALAPRNAPPAPVAEAPARVAAAPNPPPARRAPAQAAAAGTYSVQVSSQRSEADAQSSYRALQAKFPNQLGNREAAIRRADLGDKGTYYRAMVGPFTSSEQAAEFCGSLKAAGGQCLIQRN